MMANFFTLTLDTTGPGSPTIVIAGGATYATTVLVDLTIGTGDAVTTGYQMKLWGSVDDTNDTNVQTTEVASQWVTYGTTKQVKLDSVDGSKIINLKIRDDVYNESSTVNDSILLDTSLPTIDITGPDVSKISEQIGKCTSSFSFSSTEAFTEYKVKVVASSGATDDTGTVIPTTAGSANMSGVAGNYAATTPINCQIKGTDLKTASSGDSGKIIKVFIKGESGLWSA